MSNVKTGDLAQIVKAAGAFAWTLGRVVQIGARCECAPNDWVYWRFVDELTQAGHIPVHCAGDDCLKRIEPLKEPDEIARPHELERV